MGAERPDPRSFYNDYGRREWQRLDSSIDGELEFDGTVAQLENELPESGHVMDAGGGAGRYAVWLAERGYEVTLVDISERQAELARDHADEHGVSANLSVVQGSITDVGFAAETFDATCCLGGPLSHVLDEQDRVRAAQELARVTVPDGPVFVSVMGRLGFVQLWLTTGYQLELLPDIIEHGDYDAQLLAEYGYEQPFTDTHFFRRRELSQLLSNAGLTVDNIVGLEGLASPFHDEQIRANVSNITAGETDALKRVVSETNSDGAVADLSIHMLAIAQA